MTDGWKSAERTEDIRAVMMKMSDLFSPSFGGQVIFRLFGPYEGIPNLLFTVINKIKLNRNHFLIFYILFKDFAERLGDVGPVDYIQGLGSDFVRMMEQTTCGSRSINRNPYHQTVAATLIALVASLLAYYR